MPTTTTTSGSTVVFSNSTAAADLTASGTEDGSLAFTFDVLAASGGGAKTTIYSVDDGSVDDPFSGTLSKNFADYDTDLLNKDAPVSGASSATETTDLGAKFWIGTDNKVHYDASALQAQINALADGETFTDTFTYTIRMANGTLSVGTLTVVIAGANDAVAITSTPQSGSATEIADNAPGENVDTHVQGGTITYTDADNSDTHAASFSPEATGYLGTFALDTSNIDTGNGGSVGWSFSVDDGALDYLAAGETLDQYYDVKIDDGHGGAATEIVHITLTGTNDVAIFGGDESGAVTEDGTLTTGGTLTVDDADHDQSSFASTSDLSGQYGTFTFDMGTGQWSYLLDNTNGDVQALNDGDALSDVLTVTSVDGTTQDITVTINGADEAPIGPIIAGPYTGPDADPNDFDGSGVPGDNTVPSSSTGNPIYGGTGNDTLNGNNSVANTIYGGSGDDTISAKQGNDIIYGGSGHDTIAGDNNDDRIVGGYGADDLTGGNGADTFKFLDTRDTGDTIHDFTLAEGDRLDFSAIDADPSTGSDDAFTLTAGTAVVAHGINYFNDGTNTTVWVDTDGNTGTVEMQITLLGFTGTLTAGTDVIV
jgi:VCBS repeat-containing protein